ncbi:MAG: amino acid racemase [Oscillospiraceae bacterium]|jgi:aspartate racemase|nr:amino acid racemase [Oscillospiraceae bacterium]
MLKDFLGIVGGIGPLATVYFMKRITELTDAKIDQEHINMMVLSNAKTPDRTEFISGKSQENPFKELLNCCRILEKAGASLIAIPCNTSHYFYNQLIAQISTPIVHFQKETVKSLKDAEIGKVGIMATTGTISVGLFQTAFAEVGLTCCVPDAKQQEKVMEIIYASVKAGKMPKETTFFEVVDDLFGAGCEKIVLGCTELSILKEWFSLDERFLDPMDVLARFVIKYFGKKTKE